MKKKNLLLVLAISVLGLTACGEAESSVAGGASPTAANAGSAAPATVAQAQSAGSEESFGNTEYSGAQSYVEFAGITPKEDATDAKVVSIAYGYSHYPVAYTTNEGTASGYDIEMLKAVDALLPDYKFEFVPSQGGDDLLLGVQTGKFNGAVRNLFQTEERKQVFTFPEKNLGLSVTGLTVRTEDIDKIFDFASLSEAGGNLVPVDPGDGHYTVLKKWSEVNPDKAWDFETGSLASITDAYAWVAEGRYDAHFGLELMFKRNVLAEEGPAHQYADKLTWTPCAAIPTYVVLNINDKDVADALDSVIDEVWESGYPSYLQETLYGTDYIALYGRDGVGFSK